MDKLTCHHIIPRNWPELHWTNDDRNKILLPNNIHINIHRIFWNLEFHNKILKILKDDRSVIQRQFAQEIRRLMSEDPTYIYINWVYRKHD